MKKLTLIASVVIAAIATFYILTSMPFPFVQAWWHAADYDSRDRLSRRHRMADWFVMTDALVGLRRDEVLAKLGTPPPTNYFADYDLVYHLGFERGFISIDSEWLVMRFSPSGIVTEVEVVRD
jgi:hypothetical protein